MNTPLSAMDLQVLKQKRILFLINSLGGGGAERVFIRQLNALFEQGFDVSLATLYPSPEGRTHAALLQLPTERQHCLNFRALTDFAGFRRLFQLAGRGSFDLVYSTLNDANALARLVAVRYPRVRCIVREANTADKKSPKFKWLDRMTNRAVARIIAVSEETRQSILKYALHMADETICLLNGVDVPVAATQPEAGRCRLLTVGSCTEQKHQQLILDALELLSQRTNLPAYHFELVGDGGLRSELEETARALGVADRVTFRGHLPSHEVERLYQSTDIFILSSRWEGCPNVLLEAMAHGIACVSTRVGGVPDLLTNDVNGVLIPPNDTQALTNALERLIKDVRLRQRLGRAARESVQQRFSFEYHVTALIQLFHEVLLPHV